MYSLLNNLRNSLKPYLQTIGKIFASTGISPNVWTAVGLIFAFISSLVYGISLEFSLILGGILLLISGFFDIVDGQFIPKPQIEPFKVLIKKFDINPEETVFIEDIAKNLSVKKELNLKTVWLINNEYWGKKDSDKNFIDLKIKNLSSFLKEINILQAA